MKKIYTVLGGDATFVYIKEGCCGGTLKVPVSYGLVVAEGDDVEVRTSMTHGLEKHEVFSNGEWKEV